MIVQYQITDSAWTAITTAGQSGICWLDDDNEDSGDQADVRLWHDISADSADIDIARRVIRAKSNKDTLSFVAASSEDIYYARCAKTGATARLCVDTDGAGVQLINGDVALQDQSSQIVDRFLTERLGTATLAETLELDERVITLQAGHGFVVGNMIEIEEGTHSYQGDVIAVNGNDITVNMPICRSFTVAASVYRTNSNLALANGSPTTPIVFYSTPPAGVKWDINVISVNILDGNETAMDDGKFGGMAALTNGVVFRIKDGFAENIFNARNNGCFRRHCDYFEYSPAAPAGNVGLHCRRIFNSQHGDGVAKRLGGATFKRFEAIVADDVRALVSFRVVIRGHVVED